MPLRAPPGAFGDLAQDRIEASVSVVIGPGLRLLDAARDAALARKSAPAVVHARVGDAGPQGAKKLAKAHAPEVAEHLDRADKALLGGVVVVVRRDLDVRVSGEAERDNRAANAIVVPGGKKAPCAHREVPRFALASVAAGDHEREQLLVARRTKLRFRRDVRLDPVDAREPTGRPAT